MRRTPSSPAWIPLSPPRADGSTWPGATRAHGSFAAATLYAVVRREAFEPASHDVADLVLAEVLPQVDLGVEAADEAFMVQVCSAAAQVGAAVARVESRSTGVPPDAVSPEGAALLRLAADDLPRMSPRQRAAARSALHCGYFLGRTGSDGLTRVTTALSALDTGADEEEGGRRG